MSDERVIIFVDGSNLYHGLQNEFGASRLDMAKFVARLCGERRLIRTYYYNAPVNQSDNADAYQAQQRFFDRLREIPYFEVKLGRLEKRPGGVLVEKSVDIMMAVDMLQLAHRNVYDTAIVVSGDGDFSYVVHLVKDLGKHVENAYVQSGQSRVLRDTCDRFIPLTREFLRDVFLS